MRRRHSCPTCDAPRYGRGSSAAAATARAIASLTAVLIGSIERLTRLKSIWEFPHQQVGRNWLLASHLLHEERNAACATLITQRSRPGWVHHACAQPALAAADDPVRNLCARDDEWPQCGLVADKTHAGWNVAQDGPALLIVQLIFCRHTKPNVLGCL